jgi:hypothetical protein
METVWGGKVDEGYITDYLSRFSRPSVRLCRCHIQCIYCINYPLCISSANL